MYKNLDIENWNRKEHFEFFNHFDEPFFGIEAEIDCTYSYTFCRSQSIPFFLYYHYQALLAVNQTEEFRYRIKDGEIIVFDTIHVTTTISREDNTFAFSFIPFVPSFREFSELARIEIDRIKSSSGLCVNENTSRIDVIHFSTLPWISFTGVSHARNFKYKDSVPKITFGKYFSRNKRLIMPISIHAHHGLMDGFHVGQYLQMFEKFINGDSA
ncbi:MAG: CatA-like O-acetyltransferase [Bacteroidales bacterium]